MKQVFDICKLQMNRACCIRYGLSACYPGLISKTIIKVSTYFNKFLKFLHLDVKNPFRGFLSNFIFEAPEVTGSVPVTGSAMSLLFFAVFVLVDFHA